MSDEGYAAYGRVWDPSDTLLRKKWPSVFAGTPLAALDCRRRYAEVTTAGACAQYLRRRAAP